MTAESDIPGTDDSRDEQVLDHRDAEERDRYRELLEELRTILPGVQVLFAFLLTAPFSQRFAELDSLGRLLYAIALVMTALAVVVFLTPASYHRVAPRSQRGQRLRIGIRLTVVGMAILGTATSLAVFTVMRFLFGSNGGALVVAGLVLAILILWYVLPLVRRVRMDD